MLRRAACAAFAALLLQSAPARAWSFDWIGRVEVDAENLQSDDPKERLDAVTALANYDVAYTAPYLLKALDDDDASVRLEAGRVLGRGGARAAAPRITEWLGDASAQTRMAAADILGDLGGDEATAALVRTLGDPDAGVRLRAVAGLGKIGAHGEISVVVPLISRLEDEKADVRRMAVEQLEALRDKRAVIPLVALFGDSSLEVRKAAVRAVGQLGDRTAVPALLRLINDSSEEVRTLAVGALGNLGAIDAVDTLVELLGSGSDPFRAKVAFALGQIAKQPDAGAAGDAAVTALVKALASPSLRTAAREALAVARTSAVPALVASLEGRIEGDPTTAVELLKDAADARATDALVAELDRGRVAQSLVLEALGATGDPRALLPVLGLLGSNDAQVRLAAMTALRPLLGQDPRAADVLIERLADDDLEVRILAAEYLGLLRSSRAVERLASLSTPGNPPRLRHAAIDSLGVIGDPRAATALVAVLRDGPADLHRAAADALSYLAAPSTADALYALAAADRGPTRYHVVRALGSVLRARPDDRARTLFADLAADAPTPVALAAIAGLAAMGDQRDVPMLVEIARAGAPDRRRAAVWALGELHASDAASIAAIDEALGAKDDRLAGDAAWALGEIASAGGAGQAAVASADSQARLAFAIKHGGWAAAADACAALARTAEAGKLAVDARVLGALELAIHHQSRVVRLDAARALAAAAASGAKLSDATILGLAAAASDGSASLRAAAARALRTLDAAKVALPSAAKAALARLAQDSDPKVVLAATKPPTSAPRNEWRSFYVVDPDADDSPVRQEPYFVVGADGLGWATYTDARGELTSEHFPTGDAVVMARSHEDEL
ncbi:MAG TPA: HEAT repeat domain-containing protein [Kofleriaceae bacterium]|nr:HEAT repeat domain-containing protein [Kofleriaceae bacterium]